MPQDPSQTQGPTLSTAQKLSYSAIVFVFLLALIEFALRISSLQFYQENSFFPQNRDINFTNIYSKDHNLFWRLKSSISTNSELFSAIQYQTNSLGFRGADFPEKGSKTRILALGNSCTFGWGVAQNSIYTSELQNLQPATEVLNCGTPGYSSLQGKRLLAEIASKLKPDILLIMFGWNDHWPAGQGITDKEQQFPPQIALDIQNALSSLSIYKALRQFSLIAAGGDSKTSSMDQLSGQRRVPLMDFRDNLREIINYCRQNKITPVLLSPPIASLANYFSGKSISAFHDLHHSYQTAILEIGAHESVAVIDLQTPFDQHNDLFDDAYADAIHFNAAGHLLVAQQISPIIDSLLRN